MASLGQQITVGTSPTLIFECVDRETYIAMGYSRASNPNIFISGTPNDPIPILMTFPADSTVYLGGSTVVAGSSASDGCVVTGIPSITDNVVGGDSLYGVVAEGSVVVSLLVMRQNSGA
jgi:hypothetical protein